MTIKLQGYYLMGQKSRNKKATDKRFKMTDYNDKIRLQRSFRRWIEIWLQKLL